MKSNNKKLKYNGVNLDNIRIGFGNWVGK